MGRAEPTMPLLSISISNTSGDVGKIRAEHRAKTTKGPDGHTESKGGEGATARPAVALEKKQLCGLMKWLYR